jgi:hypothetical protein
LDRPNRHRPVRQRSGNAATTTARLKLDRASRCFGG